jgi:hypothetical protein
MLEGILSNYGFQLRREAEGEKKLWFEGEG